MGNRHDQQISVIGLTNRPTQLPWTGAEKLIKNRAMEHTMIPLFKISTILTFGICFAGFTVVVALVCRFMPFFPEPELPVKTPFGKLPFFDSVILYGVVILILLGLLNRLLL
jgi:hypothetical protein